jgi:hypothetical protein
MNCLDHLLVYVDNGGRRSYVERRRNSKLARIPERRTYKERRTIYDRRKNLRYESAYGFRGAERKTFELLNLHAERGR